MRPLTSLFENGLPLAGQRWGGELALSLAILLGMLLLRWLLVKLVDRTNVEVRVRYRWRKSTVYLVGGLGLILLGFVWFERFQSISTFLGLVSAGLAIALKDFVTAVAGWLFLLIRKPFDTGDRIEIKDFRGDVIDIRIFKFTLMEIGRWVDADQSTGRIVHLPNSLVITEAITNYTRGFPYVWNEIKVEVTFESDWRRAKEIMTEIAEAETGQFTEEARQELRRVGTRYLLHFTHLTPIVYTRIVASGVLLTIRHICPPRRRRGVEQAIAEAVLDRFADEPRIDLAYPTTRIYRHEAEGKPALRPEGLYGEARAEIVGHGSTTADRDPDGG